MYIVVVDGAPELRPRAVDDGRGPRAGRLTGSIILDTLGLLKASRIPLEGLLNASCRPLGCLLKAS
eukprot:6780795-Heterocapsa_arctica.AAC.1